MVATQRASPALGVAALGTLFLSLAPESGMRNALMTTPAVQLGGVVPTGPLSPRLPRGVR